MCAATSPTCWAASTGSTPDKAKILHRVLKDATGEDLPFRVAPLGEGFRELTDEEKLAQAPKSPFGSPHGADHWAAENMAEVLRGLGDYADAIKHFRTDQSATMPYLAAVHERMRDKNPMLAMKFATQMQKAGLAMAADAPEPSAPPTPQAPPPPVTQPPVANPPETTTPAPTPGPTPASMPTPGETPTPPSKPQDGKFVSPMPPPPCSRGRRNHCRPMSIPAKCREAGTRRAAKKSIGSPKKLS